MIIILKSIILEPIKEKIRKVFLLKRNNLPKKKTSHENKELGGASFLMKESVEASSKAFDM